MIGPKTIGDVDITMIPDCFRLLKIVPEETFYWNAVHVDAFAVRKSLPNDFEETLIKAGAMGHHWLTSQNKCGSQSTLPIGAFQNIKLQGIVAETNWNYTDQIPKLISSNSQQQSRIGIGLKQMLEPLRRLVNRIQVFIGFNKRFPRPLDI